MWIRDFKILKHLTDPKLFNSSVHGTNMNEFQSILLKFHERCLMNLGTSKLKSKADVKKQDFLLVNICPASLSSELICAHFEGAENVELEDTCWFPHEAASEVSALQISVHRPEHLAEEPWTRPLDFSSPLCVSVCFIFDYLNIQRIL